MARRSLEDLVLWQTAREIATEVYRQTGTRRFNADPHLRTELRTTARTIMANIAAGYGADEAACLARGFDRTDLLGNRKPGWKVHFRLGQFF